MHDCHLHQRGQGQRASQQPEERFAAGAAHNSGERTATSSSVAVLSTAPSLPEHQAQLETASSNGVVAIAENKHTLRQHRHIEQRGHASRSAPTALRVGRSERVSPTDITTCVSLKVRAF